MDRTRDASGSGGMEVIGTDKLKAAALNLGFSTVGVTDAAVPPEALEFYKSWIDSDLHASMGYLAEHLELKKSLESVLPGCQSVVVVTMNYYQALPEQGPKVARYALGKDYHKVLRRKLKALAKWMDDEFPEATHRACVDSAPVLERSLAQQAGLGWFGKNTMLIDSKRGSWFFIGVLLTTLALEPDKPTNGGCGTCTQCLDACPTGALIRFEGRYAVNSSTCISYQTIEHQGTHTTETHGWAFGCDICQEVCPFNQPRESQPLRAVPTSEPAFLDLHQLPQAHISPEEWDEKTQGRALRRAGYEGWLRNLASLSK
ncbi:MAG TPA: tRNA epoxyqueuosine(34) reductase QueG [Fimbriimonas sp.]|nr:tRNA epoxyqueuosine(34) reductase QueG [Fimbriimonas sp.]